MDHHDAFHPISVILDGSNYVMWAQAMSSFLKDRKLWRIIIRDMTKPVKEVAETHDSVTTPAQGIWDVLKERYRTTGLAHQYQLQSQLHLMHQDPRQSTNDFLSQMYSVWNQLAFSEPTWPHTNDTALFTTYRNQQRLVQFLMTLITHFEPVRTSLIHRAPLPTLEQAISKLLSKETHLSTLKTHHVDSILATPQSRTSSIPTQRSTAYIYCQNWGFPSIHLLVHCPVKPCWYFNKIGPGHLQQDCFHNSFRSSSASIFSHNGSSRDSSSSLKTPLLTPDLIQTALPNGPPLITPFSLSPTFPPDLPISRPHQVTQPPIHLRDYIVGKTHTWDVVDLPPRKTVIGCKWVYKIKTHSDGFSERYKARLVAKGFTQEYGIDYEETFAHVARLTSVCSLIAIDAARHWELFQMDVTNVFLDGDLLVEVYMQPPPGSAYPAYKVCQLQCALYGLKQAPRACFAKFSSIIHDFGFIFSSYDSALFVRTTTHGTTLLLLYVDDMIITSDDVAGILSLKQFLNRQFEMKDFDTLNYFLGLEISNDSTSYYLALAKYVSNLLACVGFIDCKTTSH
ncbi:uncharacterized protein LOC114299159 [Camellia sinensis]|uniref:uncharacterized protein LOC114299159 n=1 Tax=Camellia sinensis TaxID=4442 RepID=UPI001036BEB3|nr:uncharacterized protein LOC114299159 [Camellia sinensis]